MPDYRARVERGFLIKVEGFDWNCPQHICAPSTNDSRGGLHNCTPEPNRMLDSAINMDNLAGNACALLRE